MTSINEFAFDPNVIFFDSDGTTSLDTTARALRGHYYSGSDGNLVRQATGFIVDGIIYGFTTADKESV